MADNIGYTPGAGATVAADDIGGVLFQRVKIGVGADGSATDVSSSNPMPVLENDPSPGTSFGPITTASTVLFSAIDTANEHLIVLQFSGLFDGGVSLQASQDNSNWFSCQGFAASSDVTLIDTVYNPDVITIPVVARYFRAITTADFSGSVSGQYVQRAIDPTPYQNNCNLVGIDQSVTLAVGGVDPNGNMRRIALAENGGMHPADGRVVTSGRLVASVGPVTLIDTTGYGSVVIQLVGNWSGGTVTFQSSNDLSAWTSVAGWPTAGGATPVSTATGNGQWVFPATGKFFRVQVTTAGSSGTVAAVAVLKNFSAWFPTNAPSIAANSSVNIAQIAAATPVNSGVAGVLAIGGNIAVGTAPTANPIPLAWDGTNTRRILTDASSGGVVLSSSTVTNGQTLGRFSQTVTTPAATQIKASAGRLTCLNVSNGATVGGFLHVYNAASVTLGTTSDVHCYAIPAAVDNFAIILPDGGLYFSTGIGAAFTAGSAAADNTAFGSAPTLIANYSFI